jgi:hypothetical protein
MIKFTIYDAAGIILRTGQCPLDCLSKQYEANELIHLGESDPDHDSMDVERAQLIVGGKPQAPIDMDYRNARLNAYPSASEQLDMLWHAMDCAAMPAVEPFYSRIKAVKQAYPKDNSVVPGSVIIYAVEHP